MENITINSGGRSLEGKLHYEGTGRPGIVIVPGYRGNINSFICNGAAEKFSNEGYNVLAFNYLGHGKSDGGLHEFSYEKAGENISDAVKYLRSECDTTKNAVFASCFGSIASIFSEEKFDAQVFINPVSLYSPELLLERYPEINKYSKIFENRGYITVSSKTRGIPFDVGRQFVKDMKQGNGFIWNRHKDKKIKTLIIQGLDDGFLKIDAMNLFGLMEKDEIVSVSGVGHDFSDLEYRNLMLKVADEWLWENL